MKLDILLEVAEFIKKMNPEFKTRINTNGQANLYHEKDITPAPRRTDRQDFDITQRSYGKGISGNLP